MAMRPTTYYLLPSKPRCDFKLIVFLFCLGMFPPALGGPASAEELRTVEAIRELTLAQTEQKIPVHLRGVVTFFDEQLYSHFIQDGTAGIYLQFPATIGPPPLLPGQVVEVTGTCSPGEYAPVVVVDHIQTV